MNDHIPVVQADGDPGDEASASEIKVPVPAGDDNPEVIALQVQRGQSLAEALESKQPLVIDRRRNYDADETVHTIPFVHEPIGDQLVIKRLPEPEGLIIESDNAKEKPLRCEVVAVSKHPSFSYSAAALAALSPGDNILIRRFAGTDVKVDGVEYVIINVFDVLLKFSERID